MGFRLCFGNVKGFWILILDLEEGGGVGCSGCAWLGCLGLRAFLFSPFCSRALFSLKKTEKYHIDV